VIECSLRRLRCGDCGVHLEAVPWARAGARHTRDFEEDEISHRRHHRYLTTVVDHRAGGIVWCSAGRNAKTLQRFFDQLGQRKSSIEAASIDELSWL
jgi:transposase